MLSRYATTLTSVVCLRFDLDSPTAAGIAQQAGRRMTQLSAQGVPPKLVVPMLAVTNLNMVTVMLSRRG